MNRRALGLTSFLLLACGLALAGGWLLLTRFEPYDDEGYILSTVVNFSHGDRLYAEVYTQYGPFFYFWTDALHALFRFEFTHTAARGLTLFYWLGAALAAGCLVHPRTRSTPWALLALAATFTHLWQLTAEPLHPGGLIIFLVALGAWGGAECIARGRPRTLALLVGTLAAALALTKINVGVFFLAGAGAWLLLNARESRLSRPAVWLAGTGLVALPWLLMSPLLAYDWVVTFAAIASAGAASVVLTASGSRRPWFPAINWAWLTMAGVLVATAITALTLRRGGSLADLAEGVVRGPLRHPQAYFFSVTWEAGALAATILSLCVCLAVRIQGWDARRWFASLVAGARLVLLGLAVLAWLGWLPIGALSLSINYGPAVLWLLIVPLTADETARENARVRAWLGCLAITQMLHAYPVRGSQLGWGTFLWAPLLVLAAAEAAACFGRSPTEALQPSSRPFPGRWLAVGAAAAAFVLAAQLLHTGWVRWSSSEPLRLPGAEVMRLPTLRAARLRALTLNATVHAGALFSEPGLYSFNAWSARPTPTLANATHWFSLLSAAQQNEIVARLAADPRALVIVERTLLEYIGRFAWPVSGPLHEFLRRDFTPVFASGNYELWAKRARPVAPLSTAQLYIAEGAAAEKFQLKLCLYTPPGAQVAHLDWIDCSNPAAPQICQVLEAKNGRFELTPLYPTGHAAGATERPGLPASLPRFAQLVFFSNTALDQLPRTHAIIRVRDEQGAVVAEAIFTD